MRLSAGLHALVLLTLASQAQARRRFCAHPPPSPPPLRAEAETLTSLPPSTRADARAVSYCSDARAIEVEQFLLQYFPDETLFGSGAGTISFDISCVLVSPRSAVSCQQHNELTLLLVCRQSRFCRPEPE